MLIAYTRSSNIYDDSRATKEISAFLEKGYSVAVFGWNRDGKALEKCQELFSESENSVSFDFFSGDVGIGKVGKIIARIEWSRWLKKALRMNNSINIIHACDYDTGAIARMVAKWKKIPYVYDIFDYYIDAHPIPSFVQGFVENGEIKVINDAVTTIICTEERVEQIKKASPKNLVVIHNSPEVGKIGHYELKYDYAYCGSLYGGRLIEEILDGYSNHDDFDFVFAGNGAFASKAKRLSDEKKKFTYLGAIPYRDVLITESNARVLAAIYNPSKRNHRLCAPNKFYEALALGKPVIACRGTGIDKIIEENNIGVVIDYNADEFYSALSYLKENENISLSMGQRARILYEKSYKWQIMKMRLMKIYDDLEN